MEKDSHKMVFLKDKKMIKKEKKNRKSVSFFFFQNFQSSLSS